MTASAQIKPSMPCELTDRFCVGAGGEVWLRAVRCPASDRILYPPRLFCGPDLEACMEVLLPGDGRVNCTTRIRSRPPYGLPAGYMIGFVDLDVAPLRVFGLFDPACADGISVGDVVTLALIELGYDNEQTPCLRPVFVPAESGGRR